MRIFGRQFRSTELLAFVLTYLAANYAFIKISQQYHSATDHGGSLAREPLNILKDERDHLEVVLDSSQAHPVDGQPPAVAPIAAPKIGLAGVDDLDLATDRPPGDGDGERSWHFQGDEQDAPSPNNDLPPGSNFDYEDSNNPNMPKLKTVLFWNTFFTAPDFRFGYGHQAFLEAKCPVHTCRTTTDRNQLLTADAIVFHGPRIEDFPPPQRPPGQIYVYVQQEPHYIMSEEELPAFYGHFNVTMTHRSDSDINIPYGRVIRDESLIKPKPIHVNPNSRPKTIVWAVSHCSTPARREWYMKELQKYVDIDVYGACGDLECSKDDYLYCFSKFEKEYKFYVAMENNYCKDYISEKVYRALLYKMVPIVFGGGNYTTDTPPHSVINVADYPNPQDLAKYILELSGNDKAYNRYFTWKTNGYDLEHQRKTIMSDGFCRLCEILHDPSYRYKDYRDLKSWWVNGMCDAFAIPRWRKKYKW